MSAPTSAALPQPATSDAATLPTAEPVHSGIAPSAGAADSTPTSSSSSSSTSASNPNNKAPRPLNVIITGASTGIGRETANSLASVGHHVTLIVRSKERGEAAIAYMKEQNPGVTLHLTLAVCDLSDFSAIETFCAQYRSSGARLHILICNAGLNSAPMTKYGLEGIFVTNYLGHFHLVRLLLPVLQETSRMEGRATRIVHVNSVMHRAGNLESAEDIMQAAKSTNTAHTSIDAQAPNIPTDSSLHS